MASQTMNQQAFFGYPSQSKSATGPPHSYEFEMGVSPESFAPVFQFRKRLGEINWRKIAMIDVDKVARELDIDLLQEHMQTVAFCNVDVIADLDPTFAKLFKLAQFMIEYMLHSQASLQGIISELEGKLEIAATQQNSSQDRIKHLEGDIDKLKSENKKRRKMIEQQQMLIESGSSSYYKCPHCQKAFVNASFLQGHMQRKHPGSVNYIGDVIAHSQREQSRLAGRLEHLDADLQRERLNFEEKLQKAEEEKAAWGARTRRDMERWKKQEEGKWRKELETMKSAFVTEIQNLKAQETEYKKKITNLESTMERHSNLGELVDDIEGDRHKLTERIRSLEETNDDKDSQLRKLSAEMARLRRQNDQSLAEHQKLNTKIQSMKYPPAIPEMKVKQMTAVAKPPEPLSDPSEEYSEESQLPDFRSQKDSFIVQLRPHLKRLMEQKLQECGVDPDAPGISNQTLTNKLMVRKTERQRIAKQQTGYYGIRDQMRRKVDEEVGRRSKGSPPRKKRNGTPSHLPKQRQASRSPVAASRRQDQYSAYQPQFAAPRYDQAPSPARKNGRGRSTKHKNDQPMTRDELNTRYGDDDESFDSEISDLKPTRVDLPRQPATADRPAATTPKTPVSPVIPTTTTTMSKQDDKDSWDSDGLEDLLSPETDVRETKPRTVFGGGKVDRVAAKIESNLQNRKVTKPPAGAVDVMGGNQPPATQVKNIDSDDDDFSQISSLREESPKPAPRAAQPKVRQSTTTMSSTGTSVWGSGHGKPPAGGKEAEPEVSDWDDDISDL